MISTTSDGACAERPYKFIEENWTKVTSHVYMIGIVLSSIISLASSFNVHAVIRPDGSLGEPQFQSVCLLITTLFFSLALITIVLDGFSGVKNINTIVVSIIPIIASLIFISLVSNPVVEIDTSWCVVIVMILGLLSGVILFLGNSGSESKKEANGKLLKS
jgi:hypothetical protein